MVKEDIVYEDIIQYYHKVLRDIDDTLSVYKNKDAPEDLKEKMKKVSEYNYYNLDKASDCLTDLEEVLDLQYRDDFIYFALQQLNTCRLRIFGCVEDIVKEEIPCNISYTDYDDIVVDYYNILPCPSGVWGKYKHIGYRRVNINLGLKSNLKNLKELIRDSKDLTTHEKEEECLKIMEIYNLLKTLNGYVDSMGKEL